MGQAKRRGTYEQRKAEAIALQQLQKEKDRIRRELLEKETPKQKQQKMAYLASLMGLMAGMNS